MNDPTTLEGDARRIVPRTYPGRSMRTGGQTSCPPPASWRRGVGLLVASILRTGLSRLRCAEVVRGLREVQRAAASYAAVRAGGARTGTCPGALPSAPPPAQRHRPSGPLPQRGRLPLGQGAHRPRLPGTARAAAQRHRGSTRSGSPGPARVRGLRGWRASTRRLRCAPRCAGSPPRAGPSWSTSTGCAPPLRRSSRWVETSSSRRLLPPHGPPVHGGTAQQRRDLDAETAVSYLETQSRRSMRTPSLATSATPGTSGSTRARRSMAAGSTASAPPRRPAKSLRASPVERMSSPPVVRPWLRGGASVAAPLAQVLPQGGALAET